MYDYERSGQAKDHIFSNCKLLACTEIRAANFHSKCSMDPNSNSSLRSRRETKEMWMADTYCVKHIAKGYLQERDACAEKALEYVDAVWDKCGHDFSPISDEKSHGMKSITEIL